MARTKETPRRKDSAYEASKRPRLSPAAAKRKKRRRPGTKTTVFYDIHDEHGLACMRCDNQYSHHHAFSISIFIGR